jgi:hypothetical protein
MRLLHLPRYLTIQRAAAMPRKKVITVAVKTVLREIHNGARYVSVTVFPFREMENYSFYLPTILKPYFSKTAAA